MNEVLISEQADLDLLQIHTYVVERNRAAAFALAKEFNNKFENLGRFPFIGRDRSKSCERNPKRHRRKLRHLLHRSAMTASRLCGCWMGVET
ncbi:MAG: type II toxin-antitoxin system RelE/ParE family toxin [Pseudolabrys sp.]